MLRTACIVAFYGFLRCGEFTVSKASQFDPHINLCIEDVVFHSDLVVLKLKQSKTDPFRKGINIQLHKLGQLICPYTILLEYIQIRKEFSPTNQTDPLFITIDKKPLERQYFITCIKKVLDICGFNSSHYNGHSFRIGAATSAGKAKIEDHLIKTLGRWTSDSYIRYIRVTPASIKTAQKQRPLSAGHKPQGDPRNQMNRGHNKKPEDLDVLAAHLNELGAADKPTTTVLIEDDRSDDEEEEVVNRDGTLLASEPARPLPPGNYSQGTLETLSSMVDDGSPKLKNKDHSRTKEDDDTLVVRRHLRSFSWFKVSDIMT
ncbi:unnamed protein product [Mytilus edulis]|uniref:Tyr recombinase domain-containing protein n=1 Tax=Mytilus edulis TaxID=6550 RepID=A0A8S3SJ97_MYTED|nr:unnamed protein product [Mytilus edulis]